MNLVDFVKNNNCNTPSLSQVMRLVKCHHSSPKLKQTVHSENQLCFVWPQLKKRLHARHDDMIWMSTRGTVCLSACRRLFWQRGGLPASISCAHAYARRGLPLCILKAQDVTTKGMYRLPHAIYYVASPCQTFCELLAGETHTDSQAHQLNWTEPHELCPQCRGWIAIHRKIYIEC